VAASTTARAFRSDTVRLVQGLALCAPILLLFGAFVLYPLAFGVSQSLDWSSYQALFGDPIFVQSLVNTALYVGIAVNLKLVLALLLSGLLARPGRTVALLSMVFLLPWAVPALPGILSFRWMLNSQWGIFNHLLTRAGLASVPWLARHDTALGAVVVFHIWKYLPFWTLIFLAGRRAIPGELYEAAAIDGAGPLQQFTAITVPLLKSLYLICTLLSTVFTLGDFTIVWLMTGGAPGDSTHVLATLAYRYTFQMGRIDWGLSTFTAALPVTLALILLLMRSVRWSTT